MTIDLYYTPRSAPCRAVQMLAKTLGIELNLIEVNLVKGEQLKPDYVKVSLEWFIIGVLVSAGVQFDSPSLRPLLS